MYVCIYAELGIYSSVYCVCVPQRAEQRAVRKSDHYLGVDLKKEINRHFYTPIKSSQNLGFAPRPDKFQRPGTGRPAGSRGDWGPAWGPRGLGMSSFRGAVNILA